MGWNVYDYPSAPNDGPPRTDVEDSFDCADCGERFGESSIVDLLDMSEEIGRNLLNEGEQGSIYCCLRCALGRTKRGVILTMPKTEQKEVA
jgi:hypothetical protein